MVNTFLIGSFEDTARILDPKRRFKQAVEARQIIDIIEKQKSGFIGKIGFSSHPIVKMWFDYLPALKWYFNLILYYSVSIDKVNTTMQYYDIKEIVEYPWFLYYHPFIYSHRARLYQKDMDYYKDKFEFPKIYLNFGYIWTCRHPKEVYLNATTIEEIAKLADPLAEHYIEPKYCQAEIKSGKNKGCKCNRILKSINDFCGTHTK